MIPDMSVLGSFTPRSPEECWPWQGSMCATGYGSGSPHRATYRLFVGPIPSGLVLDHVCHTVDLECSGGTDCPHRRCVNPGHLEPVTRSENSRRGGVGMAFRPRRPAPDPVVTQSAFRPPWLRPMRNPTEAAAYIGVTVLQLAAWRKAGGGPPWLRLQHTPRDGRGASVRYRPEDLDAWLRERLKAAPLTAFAQPDMLAA